MRKGNWPSLSFLNVEVNKAMEMRWLAELNTDFRMEMVCINSLKENQAIYDFIFCGKLKISESVCLSKTVLR